MIHVSLARATLIRALESHQVPKIAATQTLFYIKPGPRSSFEDIVRRMGKRSIPANLGGIIIIDTAAFMQREANMSMVSD